MISAAIITATGEIESFVSMPDQAHVDLNTPSGCTAVSPQPASQAFYWRFSDESWVAIPPQPGPSFAWNISTKTWADGWTLLQHQDAHWETVKASRDAALISGFTWNGWGFQTDDDSRALIQGAVQLSQLATAAGQDGSDAWTLTDNTVQTLSASQIVQLGIALGTFVKANYAQSRTLRSATYATTQVAQLESITWA